MFLIVFYPFHVIHLFCNWTLILVYMPFGDMHFDIVMLDVLKVLKKVC